MYDTRSPKAPQLHLGPMAATFAFSIPCRPDQIAGRPRRDALGARVNVVGHDRSGSNRHGMRYRTPCSSVRGSLRIPDGRTPVRRAQRRAARADTPARLSSAIQAFPSTRLSRALQACLAAMFVVRLSVRRSWHLSFVNDVRLSGLDHAPAARTIGRWSVGYQG
jgi:hypothetical protein